MSSKRMSPRRTSSALAPGASTTSLGRLMVSMPSCTTPMFSKMPATTQRIQPDMRDDAHDEAGHHGDGAEVTRSWLHSQMARPLALAIAGR